MCAANGTGNGWFACGIQLSGQTQHLQFVSDFQLFVAGSQYRCVGSDHEGSLRSQRTAPRQSLHLVVLNLFLELGRSRARAFAPSANCSVQTGWGSRRTPDNGSLQWRLLPRQGGDLLIVGPGVLVEAAQEGV
jgi:hypothetical protein